MVLQRISELWESRDAEKWRRSLASYWETGRNFELEEFIDKLGSELIRTADAKVWRAFLRLYIQWKGRAP